MWSLHRIPWARDRSARDRSENPPCASPRPCAGGVRQLVKTIGLGTIAPGALDWLRNDDNVHELQLVYDHHVLRGAQTLSDLRSRVEAGDVEVEALESPIQLTLVDGVLPADGATVIEGDIDAANGAIHVIDAVMVPDSVSIP